jgi:succinate-semialdehyde dehydrogenase / glutarate-semialdehyde dehydrogenase
MMEKKSMEIATINPTTGETLKTFDALSNEEIEAKLSLAESRFESYRHTSMGLIKPPGNLAVG